MHPLLEICGQLGGILITVFPFLERKDTALLPGTQRRDTLMVEVTGEGLGATASGQDGCQVPAS